MLILLLVCSGAAALIYQIVWFQLLQLVIGSTAVSLAVLLGTFMGGMCLGSLALPRILGAGRHPLQIYALLELGIGIIGVLVLFVVPYAGGLYIAIGGYGGFGVLLRALVCTICLIPPTLLMGATFPAIARWLEATPRGISRLGFLYGANIAGATFGCLLAGFYILRFYDMAVATYVAAGINISIALAGFILARTAPYQVPIKDLPQPSVADVPSSRVVYTVIALSGLCAMGAEVVWTRLLSLLLGASVYAFSIILAVFLLGLGIGSGAGAAMSRWSKDPHRDLGICQMMLAGAIAWSAYMMASVLPYLPIHPTLTQNQWLNFGLDLARSIFAILPAACLWGASFPLALAALAPRELDMGRLAGGVYAANTAGAIIGAVGFSLSFIQWFGTRHAQQVLIAVSVVAALLALAPSARPLRKNMRRAAATAFAALLGVALMISVPPTSSGLIAYGRSLPTVLSRRDPITLNPIVNNILYTGEGMNASVAVSETPPDIRSFHISGKIEASTTPEDMRLERMLGHLPGLVHPRPRSVLIVGFGAGVTAGTFVNHPTVERIVICEIEPLIPQVVSKYFAAVNFNVVDDPRVTIIYDDARHYLLTTEEKFDIISSDPIHPWVKGAAALYTREYFQLVRRHLNPGGVVSQWVPLYNSATDAVKSELATFFEAFPGGTVWSSDRTGKGYDTVLIGQDSPTGINIDEIEERLNRRDHANVVKSMKAAGITDGIDLLSTYAGWDPDLASWLSDADINRDLNLRLQFLARVGLDVDARGSIYESMVRYRRFPGRPIAGSPETLDRLAHAMDLRRPRTLTPTQATAISKELSAGPPRRIAISSLRGDPEGLQYAAALGRAIAAGGWDIEIRESVISGRAVGLLIFFGSNPAPPEVNELFRALDSAGLNVSGNFDRENPDSILLVVGTRQ